MPSPVRTVEQWRQAPRAERLGRLTLTGDELARAMAGQGSERLARRPDGVNWAPVEVLCHLRLGVRSCNTTEGKTGASDVGLQDLTPLTCQMLDCKT